MSWLERYRRLDSRMSDSVPEWLLRGIALAALLVVLDWVRSALFRLSVRDDGYGDHAAIVSVLLFAVFVILAFGWGYIDGRADARAHPDRGRRGHLVMRWLLAGLVASLVSVAAGRLISLADGVPIDELMTFGGLTIQDAVIAALEVFLGGILGVAIGRWLVGGVAVSDAVSDIKSVIVPLRLIFWGALIVLIDLTYSKTENGVGWRFDFLNDAVGMAMIVWATARLAKIRVSDAYRTAMLFVTTAAILSLLDAIHSHFIYDTPPAVTLLSALVGVASMIAMVVFCVAMRWLSEAAGLARAVRSWKITTWLMVIIYLIPIGGLSLAAAIAIAMGSPFNIGLGPKGLLLVPVFCIPLIHFFGSTRRMMADAQSPTFEPSPHEEPDQVGANAPSRTGKRLAVPILVITSVLAVVGLFAVLFCRSQSTNPVTAPTVRVDNSPVAVAVDPGTHTVYVANNKDNTVSVIDGSTRTVTDTVFVGDYPMSVAVDPGMSTVHVANAHDDTLSKIDGKTNTVTYTVPAGPDSTPWAVAVDPSTHTVYFAKYHKETAVAVDPGTHTVYVTRRDGTVSVMDGKTKTDTATVDVGGDLKGVAVDPDTHTVYVTNGSDDTVSVIDGKTNSVTATVPVGKGANGVAVDPGTHTVYVTNTNDDTVSVIDGSTNTVTDTLDVGRWPNSVAVDPGTHTVYVTNNSDDTVSVIERP